MKKAEETKDTEKYGGGKIGHRSWLRAMDKWTFNEPIYSALWTNDHEGISELLSPPEWQSGWSIEDLPEYWKSVQRFGMRWFPLKFGSVDKGKQRSFASVFEYHVKTKRGEWF